MPFPYPVAPFIESHHERWDGSGTLKAWREKRFRWVPACSLIVDYYDALITDRPYHRAMDEHAAMAVLRSEARPGPGSPSRAALHQDAAGARSKTAIRRAVDDARDAGAPQPHASGPANGFAPETQAPHRPSMVFQNISRATQEMHALYDIAQTLGTRLSVEDTMGLLTSKLTPAGAGVVLGAVSARCGDGTR